MNALPTLSWLNTPAWLPVIGALLHTLWQGALAAGGLFLTLRLVPAQRPGLRYGLSAVALVTVVFTGVASWALLDPPHQSSPVALHHDRSLIAADKRSPVRPTLPEGANPSVPADGYSAMPPGAITNQTTSGTDLFKTQPWVRCLAACWLLGVSISLLRTVKGTLGAGRLRRRCRAVIDPRVLGLADQLRARLGVSRCVRLLISDELGVPSMLGILYPTVLLPASLLTGVPFEQLRAILAHELVHVRRWDYLANFGQMLVEALLFFNPFVWWISHQMRLEREACCDQIAAGECLSPACYVEALVAVIERGRHVAAAPPIMAVSGPDAQGGNALERARRLLVPGYQPLFRVRWFSLAAMLVISVLALSGLSWGARAVAQTIHSGEGKSTPELANGANPPARVPGLPNDVLAAARQGDAKQALDLLQNSIKPKKFGDEDTARVLDELVRARELRAFTTLYDALWHYVTFKWKPDDEALAGLVKDGRTDFIDVLIVHCLDLARLNKAAASADPVTSAWIARRVAEAVKQQADIEALQKAAANNDRPALQRVVDAGADVNGVGKDDNTPLIRAVFKNRLESAQWLLDHGAQANKPRLPGWNFTPLCLVNSVPTARTLRSRIRTAAMRCSH